MTTPKKITLEGIDAALEQFPEEERAEVRQEIEKMFENFDPEHPPGRAVPHLSQHTRECPTCKGLLTDIMGKSAALPNEDGAFTVVQLMECRACDASYSMPAAN